MSLVQLMLMFFKNNWSFWFCFLAHYKQNLKSFIWQRPTCWKKRASYDKLLMREHSISSISCSRVPAKNSKVSTHPPYTLTLASSLRPSPVWGPEVSLMLYLLTEYWLHLLCDQCKTFPTTALQGALKLEMQLVYENIKKATTRPKGRKMY